jgi:hypothetical protein
VCFPKSNITMDITMDFEEVLLGLVFSWEEVFLMSNEEASMIFSRFPSWASNYELYMGSVSQDIRLTIDGLISSEEF